MVDTRASTRAADAEKSKATRTRAGLRNFNNRTQTGRVTKTSSPKENSASDKRAQRYRRNNDGTPEEYYGTLNLGNEYVVSPYLVMRNSPGKGRGLFTREANISAGTVLMEEPVLFHDKVADSVAKNPTNFRKMVANLSSKDQKKFTSLSYSYR